MSDLWNKKPYIKSTSVAEKEQILMPVQWSDKMRSILPSAEKIKTNLAGHIKKVNATFACDLNIVDWKHARFFGRLCRHIES